MACIKNKYLSCGIISACAAALFLAACKGPSSSESGFFAGGDAGLNVSTGAFTGGAFWNDLSAAGRPDGEIAGIDKALSAAMKGRHPRSGDRYAIALTTTGSLARFAVATGTELFELRSNEKGRFDVLRATLPVTVSSELVSGTIETSLWESLASKRVSPAVILDFADIFAWEIDFLTEPRKGDRYAFIIETGRTSFGAAAGQKIPAALYNGEETGLKSAYQYKDGYYRAEGKSLKRQFLRAPLVFRRISSHFNPRRYHPVLRIFRPHNGIDYAAPPGTPVSAVADGTVSFVGRKGGYGKFIQLRHGGTYVTGYGHLRGFARGLRAGKKVAQGEVIGYVGSTGLASGPHLDFSIKMNGRFVNFLKLSLPSASSLSGQELAAFTESIRPLQERLDKSGAI
jgi:murein DD-endopeptidase MepM/ murein hydrolase activator NlpD